MVAGVRLNIPAPAITPLNSIQAAYFLMPPGVDGIRWCNFGGVSAARSALNRAKGKPHGSVIGSPTAQDAYLSCVGGSGSGGYIDTGIKDTDEITYVVVCRTNATGVSTDRPICIGTLTSDVVTGSALYVPADGQYRLRGAVDISSVATNQTTTLTSLDLTAWRMIIGQFTATERGIYNMTAGTSSGGSNTANSGRVLSPGNIFVGGGSPTYAGGIDIAVAMILDHATSSGERTAIYNWYKEILGPYGISI